MFSIYSRNDPHNRTRYLADYRSDITYLPTNSSEGTQESGSVIANKCCGAGSICKVCEDGSRWILNNQDEWIEQPKTSSVSTDTGSGESSDDESNTASDEEVIEALSETLS